VNVKRKRLKRRFGWNFGEGVTGKIIVENFKNFADRKFKVN
jgi:hypothetical protein